MARSLKSPPDLCGKTINPKLAGGGVKLIESLFDDNLVYIVRPTATLRDSKRKAYIPASDLKLCSEGTSLTKHHFEKVPLRTLFTNEDEIQNLRQAVCGLLNEKVPVKHSLAPAIQRCKADVFENLSLLKRGIRNEADLRFALADPILRLLCSYWNYTVRLEETVRDSGREENTTPPSTPPQVPQTPGTSTALAVTPDSKCDYIVYTLRDDISEVVAVLIETKTTRHPRFKHAIAQVLGYFVAYTSEVRNPPLVFVLSEECCSILVFPFHNKDDQEEDIVECLLLPDINIWVGEENEKVSLNTELLVILVLLSTSGSKQPLVCYPGQSTRKSHCKGQIITVEESMRQQLMEAKSELQSTKEAMESELQSAKEAMESELQSAKEAMESELQSTKEAMESKLQSAKEAMESELQSAKQAKEAMEAMESELQELKKLVEKRGWELEGSKSKKQRRN